MTKNVISFICFLSVSSWLYLVSFHFAQRKTFNLYNWVRGELKEDLHLQIAIHNNENLLHKTATLKQWPFCRSNFTLVNIIELRKTKQTTYRHKKNPKQPKTTPKPQQNNRKAEEKDVTYSRAYSETQRDTKAFKNLSTEAPQLQWKLVPLRPFVNPEGTTLHSPVPLSWEPECYRSPLISTQNSPKLCMYQYVEYIK